MEKRRFLLCVTGVGAGNTTRNLAILRELRAQGPCEIRVAAQGRARELLEPHYPTEGLHEISYGQSGQFAPLSILRANMAFPVRFVQNMRRLAQIMTDYRPHLVIADSDFYCLRPARRLGFRLVSLNNAAIIVETVRRRGDLPPNCRFSYHVIERSDYWLQRRYPQRVLCPTLTQLPQLPRKFVQIPPMVRPEIEPLDRPGEEIVVLTGGSGIDADKIDLRLLEGERIRMLGTPLSKVPPGAQTVGFTLDVMQHFRRAKVLVVQGGFSSVSEAVALRVPTVVIPIANHAEQWVNGKLIEQLGIGLSAPSAAKAGMTVKRVLENYDRFRQAAQRLRLRTDGHTAAARRLWQWAAPRGE